MSKSQPKHSLICPCCNPALTLLWEKILVSRRMLLLGTGSLLATVALNQGANSQSLPLNLARKEAETYGKEGETIYKAEMVSGTVFCRQRIPLPPNATLIVKLEDISRADAPAIVIAEQKIELNGRQVPIPFTLTYNPAQIDPRFRYAVRAQIFIGNQLAWTSTQVYPVITQNNPKEVEIRLEQV